MSKLSDHIVKAIGDFENAISQDSANVRTQKGALRTLLSKLYKTEKKHTYIRDDHVVIISAPKIILGDVDENGMLKDSGGTVVIRGGTVSLQATGADDTGGTIEMRGSKISQVAEDPGCDGFEHAVRGTSSISSVAKSVFIGSHMKEGAFDLPDGKDAVGVKISSDTRVDICAAPSYTALKKSIEEQINTCNKLIEEKKGEYETIKKDLKVVRGEIDNILDKDILFSEEEKSARTYELESQKLQKTFAYTNDTLCRLTDNIYELGSQLADLHRRKKALDAYQGALPKEEKNIENNANGSAINFKAEKFLFECKDGDNKYRAKTGSFTVYSPTVHFSGENAGVTAASTSFSITCGDINLKSYTVDKQQNGNVKYEALGNVTITGKNIQLHTANFKQEGKDKPVKEESLVAGGSVNIRTDKFVAVTNETSGKYGGATHISSKNVFIGAMEYNDEKMNRMKSVALDGTLTLGAKTLCMGGTDDKNRCEQIQMYGKKLKADVKEEVEISVGDAVASMKQGVTAVGGKKVEIRCDTEAKGKLDVAGEVKAQSVNADNIKANNHLECKNINDGIASPAANQKADGLKSQLKNVEVKLESIKVEEKK